MKAQNKKKGKATGPDNVPVEVWQCFGDEEVGVLSNFVNNIYAAEKCQMSGEIVSLFVSIRRVTSSIVVITEK